MRGSEPRTAVPLRSTPAARIAGVDTGREPLKRGTPKLSLAMANALVSERGADIEGIRLDRMEGAAMAPRRPESPECEATWNADVSVPALPS
jgi:hypothetical protein